MINRNSLEIEQVKKIIESARRLFYSNGYRTTNMREIARGCNMTTGALYHYLGGKDDILHLLVEYSTRQVEELEEFRKELSETSLAEVLVKTIKKFNESSSDQRDLITFYNREVVNFSQRDRETLLQNVVSLVELFRDIIEEGRRNGEFDINKDSVVLMAHNIVMYGHDYAMRRWYLKNYYSQKKYTDLETQIVLKALGARKK